MENLDKLAQDANDWMVHKMGEDYPEPEEESIEVMMDDDSDNIN